MTQQELSQDCQIEFMDGAARARCLTHEEDLSLRAVLGRCR
jgi:hypothetical protein